MSDIKIGTRVVYEHATRYARHELNDPSFLYEGIVTAMPGDLSARFEGDNCLDAEIRRDNGSRWYAPPETLIPIPDIPR